MNKLLPLSIITLAILGCASKGLPEENICFSDEGEVMDCRELSSHLTFNTSGNNSVSSPEKAQDPTLFKSNINFVQLSEYVEQMAMELKSKLSQNLTLPVAVTSFVTLDSTLNNTTLLGNQVSEYFINELKGVGIPVSDYKVTSFIQVTPNGDLAMSRRIHELKTDLNIGYVLTGTLIENKSGIIINSRIVSLSTNNVIASASKLVPTLIQ
ncbi:hypothetical protein KO505_03935 [Psychrosphaera sp. F3M07]|uniref:FlgO family outer membrane protein n=1 Tax=Psychrosphaera sp. F3M07 TaxID=2841560 RepID=UPI001C0A3BC7|nr:FlgO family outer membrane protein [Psychrosphaera sp. F3M07]MBU2917113.1 hypothetical protein [Psychrosphaera sp. F3M07]